MILLLYNDILFGKYVTIWKNLSNDDAGKFWQIDKKLGFGQIILNFDTSKRHLKRHSSMEAIFA